MQEAFVNINKIPTKVITFGRWITEKPGEDEKKIILVIPGNPGITGFYKVFMKFLYEKHRCPVWALGYAGHEKPKNKSDGVPVPKLMDLKAQIQQKVSFIEQYVPENIDLHIIGHSIGGYMTLQLLKEPSIKKKINQTYLLFPTIERMIETPNGRFLYNYVRPILTVVMFLAWIFTILPKIISLTLLRAYMLLHHMPSKDTDVIFSLIDPKILQQVFFLAFKELDQVCDRDNETIRNNSNKICILYGEKDGWCIREFYDSLKQEHPGVKAKMSKYQHTFIFNENEEVAEVVNLWMKEP